MNRTIAFIGLGSNLSHPRRQVARALRALARLPASRMLASSRNYISAPVGCASPQPDYVNAVAALCTSLAPRALLERLQGIERRQLRQRTPGSPRNAARTLDLDLLLYGRRRMRVAQLTLPHPRLHQRAFTLRPLFDIAPTVTIPGRGLARRHWPDVKSQRIARTRAHFLR